MEDDEHQRIKSRALTGLNGPSVLVVLHDLTVTGAPMAGLHVVKAMMKNGWRPLVVACRGGGLVPEIEKLGLPMIISPNYVDYQPTIRRLAAGFELVLVNSLVLSAWLNAMFDVDHVMWYVHEAVGIAAEAESQPKVANALRRCRNLYVVSEHAASFVPSYAIPRILPLGVEDRGDQQKKFNAVSERRLRLATVGTISHTKGQDLVVEALMRLEPGLRSRLEFIFLGVPFGKENRKFLESLPPELPIVWAPEIIDQEAKWNFYSQVDVFCVPSRDESCSLVLLEACMLGKPVIISDRVGGRYMVEEGRNGLIFTSENIEELRRALEWLITHPERLPEMGRESRVMFLKKATVELFERNLMDALQKIVNRRQNTSLAIVPPV